MQLGFQAELALNYRHAYHAGNFADVLKHAVLVALIEAFKQKATPFSVLDTHAGSARYLLTSTEAEKTREFASGIKPLLSVAQMPSLLHVYLNVVRSFNPGGNLQTYPGSPLIAASLLRANDALVACELQPDEARKLKAEFQNDARVSCHQRDGYEALRALLPPKPKRGLVLIDPPFEAQFEEYNSILLGLKHAHQRWPTGTYAIWFPIKLRQDAEAYYRQVAQQPFEKVLVTELLLHPANTALRLNGCGMVIVNPPYRIEHSLGEILPALGRALEQSRYGSHEVRFLKS